MKQDQKEVQSVGKAEKEPKRIPKAVANDDIILKQISKRIEETMVAQKNEELRVPIAKTKSVSGIMTREALESARSLAKRISENRIDEWV
ncbi:MAG: hypothetical protein NTY68_03165 [Candidatus Micrarchaeota archaeon]|nr:hypothetical protein [Candidatus Micrarchaeota archaeon]